MGIARTRDEAHGTRYTTVNVGKRSSKRARIGCRYPVILVTVSIMVAR